MRLPSIARLPQCSWFPFSDEPVLSGLWYIPKLCDPAFLFPEEAPDEKWHLFAHSWLGIHHFISSSGIAWEPVKMVEVRGHSPFIFFDRGTWYLLYEKHDGPLPFIEKGLRHRVPRKDRLKASRIEMRSSNDLLVWSEPRLLLDSREIPFAKDYLDEPRISRPQMVVTNNGYRLYFGASHLMLPDTKQKVSRYFAMAEAESLSGPFVLGNGGKPLLEPMPDDPYRNLGCGSIKVVPGLDGLAAFQCGAAWDAEHNKSTTKMIMLMSPDGVNWHRSAKGPILVPADEGWANRYIMGCDIRYKQDESCWYCYFSANGKRTERPKYVRESLGLLLGKDPVLKKMPF